MRVEIEEEREGVEGYSCCNVTTIEEALARITASNT
jgi:hypothetical protein